MRRVNYTPEFSALISGKEHLLLSIFGSSMKLHKIEELEQEELRVCMSKRFKVNLGSNSKNPTRHLTCCL